MIIHRQAGPHSPQAARDEQAQGVGAFRISGNPQAIWPLDGSLVAISATKLQGVYATPENRAAYAKYRAKTPTAVLGGTIYVYDERSKP